MDTLHVSPYSIHLLNTWLRTHPVRTKALSKVHLRTAAAKIILRKKNLALPGQSPQNIAAILLVLYVQEGHLCQCDTVLGLSMQDLFDMLRDEVLSCGISRTDLLAEAAALDRFGQTAHMCKVVGLPDSWWSEATAPGGVAGPAAAAAATVAPSSSGDVWMGHCSSSLGRCFRVLRGMWAGVPAHPSFESARIPESGKGEWTDSIRSIVLKHLSQRHLFARVLLALSISSFYILSDAYNLWSGPAVRMAYFGTVMVVGALVCAGSYPSDIHSPSGRLFLTPALTVCAACAVTASSNSLRVSWPTMPNNACRACHVCLCAGVVVNWWSSAILCVRGRATWRVVRIVLVIDSALFFTCNVLLYLLGPPSSYQPRNVPFPDAMQRTAAPLVVASLLTAERRHKIADFFNAIGWNHVTVGLTDLRHVHAAADGDAAGSGDAAASRGAGRSKPPAAGADDASSSLSTSYKSLPSTAATSEFAFRLARDANDKALAATVASASSFHARGGGGVGRGGALMLSPEASFDVWYQPRVRQLACCMMCVCLGMFAIALSDDPMQQRLLFTSGAAIVGLVVCANSWRRSGAAASADHASDELAVEMASSASEAAGASMAVGGEDAGERDSFGGGGGGGAGVGGSLGRAARVFFRVQCITPPSSEVASLYMAATILYSLSLPADVISSMGRARLAYAPRATALAYFALGTLVSLQPTDTRRSHFALGAFFSLFGLRLLQLCAVDEEPRQMFVLCFTSGIMPFAVGMAATWLPERVMRQLWMEMRDAKQLAQDASAEAAAERSHAWALEVAQRERLTVRPRGPPRSRGR